MNRELTTTDHKTHRSFIGNDGRGRRYIKSQRLLEEPKTSMGVVIVVEVPLKKTEIEVVV